MGETRLENIYRGFSCPQQRLEEHFLALIVTGYARGLTVRFIGRCGRRLDNQGKGLVALLRNWAIDAQGFEIGWDFAFGRIRAALLSDSSSSVASRAAALSLRLHECGVTGEWGLRLDAPVRLLMGRWLLPIADHIEVQAGTRHISAQTRFKGLVTPVAFWRCDGRWQSQGAEALPEVAIEKHMCVLLPAHALDDMEFDDVASIFRGRSTKTILAALESAVALLGRHAPLYRSWVDRVVRHIIPLSAPGSSMQSGSDTGLPGVIHMSLRGSPAAVAEMLIHEATHQYLNLLCRLGALDDGSDRTLYYSPVRKTGRPIRAILVAYHAFANVLLFYRSCVTNGADNDQYGRRSEKVLVPQLKQLEAALRTTRALTPLGRALWEPLAAQWH